MFKTSVNERPHCPLTSSFYREPDRISAQTYIARNYGVPAEDLRVCLSLLAFTQLFLESRAV